MKLHRKKKHTGCKNLPIYTPMVIILSTGIAPFFYTGQGTTDWLSQIVKLITLVTTCRGNVGVQGLTWSKYLIVHTVRSWNT
uniref:Uncharacterized protein n=1 Tax=Arion vulgaris TaxID=1028688 RepID=A0A0B6Z8H2_9EUPU